MKKIIALLSIISLMGCDPDYCANYKIKNNLDEDVKVVFYGEENDTIYIKSSAENEFLTSCEMGGGPPILSLEENDSIVIMDQNFSLRKIYYPTSSGKNIFDVEEDWVKEKTGKRAYKYTFTITEEDINNSDTEK